MSFEVIARCNDGSYMTHCVIDTATLVTRYHKHELTSMLTTATIHTALYTALYTAIHTAIHYHN